MEAVIAAQGADESEPETEPEAQAIVADIEESESRRGHDAVTSQAVSDGA
eukprot:COSAG02_NODE_73869_length_165_cov_321.090909_1_plen_49_part_01